MADVRFLILCGPPSLDPSTVGYPPSATTDGWWYAWRLMASNNRRLARGVTSFPSRSLAVDAITLLRTELNEVLAQVRTDPRRGSWTWDAEHGGECVATCPHPYERERDCRGGFQRFVDAVPRAQVAEGGIILRDHHRVGVPTTVPTKEPRRWQDL